MTTHTGDSHRSLQASALVEVLSFTFHFTPTESASDAYWIVKSWVGSKTGLIIFIYCNWVVTLWQWLFYTYT